MDSRSEKRNKLARLIDEQRLFIQHNGATLEGYIRHYANPPAGVDPAAIFFADLAALDELEEDYYEAMDAHERAILVLGEDYFA